MFVGWHGKARHTVRHSKMLIQTICNLTYWWLHDCYNLFMGMTKNTCYFMLRKNCLFLIDKVVLFACFIWYTISNNVFHFLWTLSFSHPVWDVLSFCRLFCMIKLMKSTLHKYRDHPAYFKIWFPLIQAATGNVWSKIYCELHFD